MSEDQKLLGVVTDNLAGDALMVVLVLRLTGCSKPEARAVLRCAEAVFGILETHGEPMDHDEFAKAARVIFESEAAALVKLQKEWVQSGKRKRGTRPAKNKG